MPGTVKTRYCIMNVLRHHNSLIGINNVIPSTKIPMQECKYHSGEDEGHLTPGVLCCEKASIVVRHISLDHVVCVHTISRQTHQVMASNIRDSPHQFGNAFPFPLGSQDIERLADNGQPNNSDFVTGDSPAMRSITVPHRWLMIGAY